MFTIIGVLIFLLKYLIIVPCLLFAVFHGTGKLLYILFPLEEDDSNRTIEEIVASRGFLCESHSVTTEDGYILGLHRIVHPENIFTRKYFQNQEKAGREGQHVTADVNQNRGLNAKPAVLLQHGMFSNSRAWLIASNDGHLGIDPNRRSPSASSSPSPIPPPSPSPIPPPSSSPISPSSSSSFSTPEALLKEVSKENKENESKESGSKVDNCLAFALAKAGYDVFLGNVRGNQYSLKHERLDYEKDDAFWNCSMSEIIEYDLPASIDYILNVTGQRTLGYIGFSQGTSSMIALLADKIKYNDIVRPFIAMAPVANAHHTNLNLPEPFKQRLFTFVANWCHSRPGPVLPLATESIARYMLSNFYFKNQMNKLSHSFLILSNYGDMNRNNIYRINAGSHCMRRNLAHVLQNIASKHYRQYDHGKEGNLRKYGTVEPPIYDLKRITNKYMCFMYSRADMLVRYEDVLELKKRLPVPLMDDLEVPGYNHLDFHFAQNLGSGVNKRILLLLDTNAESIKNDPYFKCYSNC